MQENLKKEIKVEKKVEFIKLSDLKEKDLKSQKFVMAYVVLRRRVTRIGYRYMIIVNLVETYLSLDLMPSAEYVSADRFNLILLELGLPTKDQMNREKLSWELRLPIRLVKGFDKDGREYLYLEILYKQYLYDVHFFNSDQRRIIEKLIKEDKFPYEIIERPDVVEVDDVIGFKFE